LIFIGIDADKPFELDRERGFRDLMAQHGLAATVVRLANHGHVATDYINQHWSEFEPNTAFICASDRLAIGIEDGILLQGGRVPADFGVIGFDGMLLNQVASKRLTTMKQPLEAMGQAAAKLLLTKIKQPQPAQEKIIIKSNLSVAESTR